MALILPSAVLVGACGDGDRPPLLSDEEAGSERQTPIIGASSGSGSGSTASADCDKGTSFANFYARSQADLSRLSGYTAVSGDVFVGPITGGPVSDVNSLQPLRCLETVSGSFGIQSNPSLRGLSGLERLRQVGSFTVNSNEQISTLGALKQLSVGYTLRVTSNDVLSSVGDGITAAGSLNISGNPQLPQCRVDELAERLHAGCSCDGNLETTTCN